MKQWWDSISQDERAQAMDEALRNDSSLRRFFDFSSSMYIDSYDTLSESEKAVAYTMWNNHHLSLQSESKASEVVDFDSLKRNPTRNGVHILELKHVFFNKSQFAPHGKDQFIKWLIEQRGYDNASAIISMEEVYERGQGVLNKAKGESKANEEFKEGDHPRSSDGKFGSGSGNDEDYTQTEEHPYGEEELFLCGKCKGSGEINGKECPRCGGTGAGGAKESRANEGIQDAFNLPMTDRMEFQMGYQLNGWLEKAGLGNEWNRTMTEQQRIDAYQQYKKGVKPEDYVEYSYESKANENVASKMAYYYQKDAPKDWNDNQVSNEAEKILEETYGIKPKKEVVKEKAVESLSTVQQKIVDRKLDGVRNESIIHELKIWDNMSEEQAKKAVETTEIPLQDSIAHTLFNKKYTECNENEIQELKIYAGESRVKATEGTLGNKTPYPDPECKICGRVMINVWGDTRDEGDWSRIEDAIKSHYQEAHYDDETVRELINNDIQSQHEIFWGESKAKEGVNDERLSTDAGIVKFLEAQGASRYYIDFVLRFPNSPSPAGWIRHWKDGYLDFGGGFGSALFDGDIEDAYFRADGENRGNLQKMGIRFSRDDGTFDIIEDGRITGNTTESKSNEALRDEWWWKHVTWESGFDQDFMYCNHCKRDMYAPASYVEPLNNVGDDKMNKFVPEHLKTHGITPPIVTFAGLTESKKVNKRRGGVY